MYNTIRTISLLLFLHLPAAAPARTSIDSIIARADSIGMMNLDAVTVTARRPDAIVTADKISYTPAATLSGSSGNIFDTLSSLPGVSIDSRGNISVNGQPRVSITIDGRKSILSGDALLNYLKSLPTANVARIEIVTTPSARQEASDAPTLINIRLKRKSDEGFTLGTGSDLRLWKARRGTANIHAGYTRGNHRLSLTYATMAARYPSLLITDRPYADTGMRLTQHYNRRRKDIMHNVSMAYDTRFATAFSLGTTLAANMYTRREHAGMHTTSPESSAPAVTDNRTRFNTRNIYGNLYLRHASPRPESDITLSLDFFNHRNTERQDMTGNDGSDIDCDMGGTTAGYVGALDMRHTLSDRWHISAGVRTSFVSMHNDGEYSGTADLLGSTFGYDENVNAIYAESRARYGRLTATAGLRMEQGNLSTTFSGNEAMENTDYRTHTLDLFPTLSLSFEAADEDDLALSYAKRIKRPRYADLNPFIHIYDDITHIGGNINLRPSVTHTLQAAWSHAAWLRVSASMAYTRGDIVKCYREISRDLVYVSPENIPHHMGLTLSIAAVNIPVTSWWRLSATGTLLYNGYRFPPHTAIRPNCLITPMADVRSLFDFPHGWSAEVSGSVRGRTAYGQARISTSGQLYIGVRKSILDSHGYITLYVRDLLNTNHRTSSIHLADRQATIIEREYEDMRLIGASFSLRFNAGKPSRHIPAKNSWTDEMNRVNL